MIKKFLKPDWRKIVLFIIFLILEILLLISISDYLSPPTTVNPCCLSNIPEKIREQCINANANCGFTDITFGYPEIILLLIFGFVLLTINYLLSCFIVWIYDEIKKKK
jgi:hypothetical protein